MIRKILLAACAAFALSAPAHAQFVYYPGWFKTMPNGSTLTDSGAGVVVFSNGGANHFQFSTVDAANSVLSGGNIIIPSTGFYIFNSRTLQSAPGDGAWLFTKNSGAQLTVSTLPSCTSGNDGMRAFVTDATATTFASSAAGSGANHAPVYCDGSGTPTWKIG